MNLKDMPWTEEQSLVVMVVQIEKQEENKHTHPGNLNEGKGGGERGGNRTGLLDLLALLAEQGLCDLKSYENHW